jgi:hypothetical protein
MIADHSKRLILMRTLWYCRRHFLCRGFVVRRQSRDPVQSYIYNLLYGGTSSGAIDYCLNPSVEADKVLHWLKSYHVIQKDMNREWTISSRIVSSSMNWPEHSQCHSHLYSATSNTHLFINLLPGA